jgi:hypothetical protein
MTYGRRAGPKGSIDLPSRWIHSNRPRMIVAAAHQGEDDEMSISTMLSGYSSMSNSAEIGEYRGCFNESIEDPAVARHHADIKAVYTLRGHRPIQSLIVGRTITGLNAFR